MEKFHRIFLYTIYFPTNSPYDTTGGFSPLSFAGKYLYQKSLNRRFSSFKFIKINTTVNITYKPVIKSVIYGAYLADGSEYRGYYDISDDDLYTFHKHRMELLIEAGAEILAIETIPSLIEAKITSGIAEEWEPIAG